jgi:hypothetical protein
MNHSFPILSISQNNFRKIESALCQEECWHPASTFFFCIKSKLVYQTVCDSSILPFALGEEAPALVT